MLLFFNIVYICLNKFFYIDTYKKEIFKKNWNYFLYKLKLPYTKTVKKSYIHLYF